jgi:hypothetical protein
MQILCDRRQKNWDIKCARKKDKVNLTIAARIQAREKKKARVKNFNKFSGYSGPSIHIGDYKPSARPSFPTGRFMQSTGPPVSMRGGKAFDPVIARPNSHTELSCPIEDVTYVEFSALKELVKASEPDYESILKESWQHPVYRFRHRRCVFVRDWVGWAGEVGVEEQGSDAVVEE